MSTDRYNKAARDGYLDALKEATKKDLNTRDEDGMTPTLWASFEGNVDALRLIVGRGGDPDKCDNYGNTALHFAAARGHIQVISFLVNFGINLYALDIDFHTPKDLAAINDKEDILRYLDAAIAKEEAKDKKKVKALKEKAEAAAQKRVKEFDKLQKKANRSVEEDQKKLERQREKMAKSGTVNSTTMKQNEPNKSFFSLRKDSLFLYGQSPKFSEIVANSDQGSGSGGGKQNHLTGVYRKVQQRKTMSGSSRIPNLTNSGFKVAEVESDGKRTIRSLSGLQRDNEVMYVPKYDISAVAAANGKRGKISGLFEEDDGNEDDPSYSSVDDRRNSAIVTGTTHMNMNRSISKPEYLNHDDGNEINAGTESTFNDDHALPHNKVSMFERPGFGSVAFRHTMSSALSNFPRKDPQDGDAKSQSSQNRSHSLETWEEDDLPPSDEEDEDQEETGPVELFLAAAGLSKYIPIFIREKIDLEELMRLSEGDLISLGMELGPRRKLLRSISEREQSLVTPGEIIDSRL